jgi:hypothetical protein
MGRIFLFFPLYMVNTLDDAVIAGDFNSGAGKTIFHWKYFYNFLLTEILGQRSKGMPERDTMHGMHFGQTVRGKAVFS